MELKERRKAERRREGYSKPGSQVADDILRALKMASWVDSFTPGTYQGAPYMVDRRQETIIWDPATIAYITVLQAMRGEEG